MGVRGLTSFINNRSHIYLKDYQLHDCNVILDGNSIAASLYKWHCKSNDCFGGDYDLFANVIYGFFKLLAQCNIVSYVIFDGGYEKRKLITVISRMKNKIRSADILNTQTQDSDSVFPLFLREVFIDIILELGIKTARCEFEADMEIANIAKALGCPVISYDSDFYIFGSLYIPFPTVELTVKTKKNGFNKIPYLPCKIFKIEYFLESFGGLNKNHLPLLAVILGNDYIKGSLFRPFFKNLKLQKCAANQSDQQKRIKSVIIWLQNETVESAIKTVLSRFKSFRRHSILKKIENVMRGYNDINSELLQFLEINFMTAQKELAIDFDALEGEIEMQDLDDEDDNGDVGEEGGGSEQSDIEIVKKLEVEEKECEQVETKKISDIFLRNFRKCQYPSCFMDILTQHKYYCIPQVEDSQSEHSHIFSLDILSYMHKTLCNSSKPLTVICRVGKANIRYIRIPNVETDTCTLEEIQSLTEQERKIILIKALGIDKNFLDSINVLSSNWHLFFISLRYALKKTTFEKALIMSVIMCFYMLNYIDKFVGFCRTQATFLKKYAAYEKTFSFKSEDTLLGDISFKDCMNFLNIMIGYFHMDTKLRHNYKLYDKLLVHSLSQLQSILLHVKYLNLLLNCPFPNIIIHKIFNGTFMYNMTSNLRKRNVMDYLELLLKDTPGTLENIKYIIQTAESVGIIDNQRTQIVKKRRKKKKQQKVDWNDKPEVVKEDGYSSYEDPNNPYSLLMTV